MINNMRLTRLFLQMHLPVMARHYIYVTHTDNPRISLGWFCAAHRNYIYYELEWRKRDDQDGRTQTGRINPIIH